jgi:hypothetical protein
MKKQCKGRGPQGDEAHHATHHEIAGIIASTLRFRLRCRLSCYIDADRLMKDHCLWPPFPYFCVYLPVSTGKG